MGLAPYGKAVYADILREKVIQIHEDGSHLNLDYFGFLSSDQMDHPVACPVGGPTPTGHPHGRTFHGHRGFDSSHHREIMIKLARHAHAVTGHRNLSCRRLALMRGQRKNPRRGL